MAGSSPATGYECSKKVRVSNPTLHAQRDCPTSLAACNSRQPALAPLVVFDVAVGFASADLVEPEIELLDVGILAQGVGRAFEHDASVLHYIAVVGDVERQCCVLLDQQHGQVALVAQPADDAEDLLD